MITATLSYTPSLVRRAVFGYLRRRFGRNGLIALAGVVALDAYLIATDPRSWPTAFLLGATALLVFGLACMYLIVYRQASGKLARMGEPHAVLELSEDELRASSGSGT